MNDAIFIIIAFVTGLIAGIILLEEEGYKDMREYNNFLIDSYNGQNTLYEKLHGEYMECMKSSSDTLLLLGKCKARITHECQ